MQRKIIYCIENKSFSATKELLVAILLFTSTQQSFFPIISNVKTIRMGLQSFEQNLKTGVDHFQGYLLCLLGSRLESRTRSTSSLPRHGE